MCSAGGTKYDQQIQDLLQDAKLKLQQQRERHAKKVQRLRSGPADTQPDIDLVDLKDRATQVKKMAQETIEEQEEQETQVDEQIKDLISKAKKKYLAGRERQAIRYMKKVQRAKKALKKINKALDQLEDVSELIETSLRRLGVIGAVKRSSETFEQRINDVDDGEDSDIDEDGAAVKTTLAFNMSSSSSISAMSTRSSSSRSSAVSEKVNKSNMDVARTIHKEIVKAESNIVDIITKATSVDQEEEEEFTDEEKEKLLSKLMKLIPEEER